MCNISFAAKVKTQWIKICCGWVLQYNLRRSSLVNLYHFYMSPHETVRSESPYNCGLPVFLWRVTNIEKNIYSKYLFYRACVLILANVLSSWTNFPNNGGDKMTMRYTARKRRFILNKYPINYCSTKPIICTNSFTSTAYTIENTFEHSQLYTLPPPPPQLFPTDI